MSSLHDLNLSFNNFDGEVPRGGVFDNVGMVSVEGNDDLCTKVAIGGIPFCSALVDRKRKYKSLVLVLQIVIPLAAVVIITLCLVTMLRRRRIQAKPHSHHFSGHMKISYLDIVRATDGFSPENLIGSGSFGTVYKGSLKFQQDQVAIKIFKPDVYGAQRSFAAECETLRNVRHRNVVKIITSCSSVDSTGANFKALAFQYMPNGNLEMWLHPKTGHNNERNSLTLSQRINIALDIAFALDYLHNQCEPPLIHCDLNPRNILLDLDMVAYVNDFGLARFLLTTSDIYQDSPTSLAGLKGSIGYIPPEYGMSENVSTMGDVYSFGMLLLELMTGCSPTNEKFNDGIVLREFVDRAFPKNIPEVVDPKMIEDDNNATGMMENCVFPLLRIGLCCSKTSPKERPEMGQISNEILRIKHAASKSKQKLAGELKVAAAQGEKNTVTAV